MTRLAVILTTHNRKEHTLSCLNSVTKQVDYDQNEITIYLTDSGSTDGTVGAIRHDYPQVRIIQSSTDLFWNQGMRIGFAEAIKGDYDYYLWLNDDTVLFNDAIKKLINTSEKYAGSAIIVGSTQDPGTKEWSYGGFIRKDSKRPLKFSPVLPKDFPIPIETMNGNIVLLPSEVVEKVGNLDPAFSHAIGDFDYGLRAQKLGVRIFIAPEYHGYCIRNPQSREIGSVFQRAKHLLSKKGLPPVEWARFAKRYAGKLWFIYWLSPYSKILMTNSNNHLSEG